MWCVVCELSAFISKCNPIVHCSDGYEAVNWFCGVIRDVAVADVYVWCCPGVRLQVQLSLLFQH